MLRGTQRENESRERERESEPTEKGREIPQATCRLGRVILGRATYTLCRHTVSCLCEQRASEREMRE